MCGPSGSPIIESVSGPSSRQVTKHSRSCRPEKPQLRLLLIKNSSILTKNSDKFSGGNVVFLLRCPKLWPTDSSKKKMAVLCEIKSKVFLLSTLISKHVSLFFRRCFFFFFWTATKGMSQTDFEKRSIWSVRFRTFSPGAEEPRQKWAADRISPVMSAESAQPGALVTFAPICSSVCALGVGGRSQSLAHLHRASQWRRLQSHPKPCCWFVLRRSLLN